MNLKYLFFSAFFLLSLPNLRAQFLPLLDGSHEWSSVEIHCQPEGNSYSSSKYVLGADSTITATTYRTIWQKSATATTYYGSMREDAGSGKVWYRFPYSESEGLLYDFSAQVGDTISLLNQLLGPDTIRLYIVTRDSVFLNNQWRAKITMTNFAQSLHEWWIEGMGSNWGLLRAGNSYYSAACGGEELLCFWENNTQIYQNQAFPTCEFTPADIDEQHESPTVAVFPNPASRKLSVRTSVYGSVLELYSSTGELVRRQITDDHHTDIYVANLPSGIYNLIIVVAQSKQRISRRVVIIGD